VECRRGPASPGAQRLGVAFEGQPLSAGERATCTFRNIRLPSLGGLFAAPAIAIRKTGPALARAGATLRYKLLVTNPGAVAFAASAVTVTDAACDAAPQLVSRAGPSGGDPSPGTLDPGDTWTYHCSNATPSAGANCQASLINNAAGVTSGAVQDQDAIATILLCPNQPDPIRPIDPPGPAPAPSPSQPGPVQPAGAAPPDAGVAAAASLRLPELTRGCIRSSVPRVNFEGTRVARLQVFINGHLARRLTLETLQRRVTPRITAAPGRYRVTVRVTFQRGSGSQPLTLSRVVRICGPPPPRFTG
jgi:hypothetical protein